MDTGERLSSAKPLRDEPNAIHVLVVDDEPELCEVVRDYLVRHGFVVTTVDGGVAMRDVMKSRPVHIVIVDLRMPGEDGLSIVRWLRELGGVGVIMLTASAEAVDRIVGLEIGADDYLAKPFDPRELLARVRSLVRRLGPATETRKAPQARLGREIRIGRILLNLDARTAYSVEGLPIPLTAMEFELLRAFGERPNRVLSRDQLLTLTQHDSSEAFDRSIDVRVLRIRRKIEYNPRKPSVIRTVHGVGYVFEPSD